MKIVFMGTPDFAVPTLAALVATNHDVALVVTGPDKPKGRGRHLQPTPVKKFAREARIPIYQPANLKSDAARDRLEKSGGELYVVVAFRILPEQIIELPSAGVINLHASLLPAYRGAAPIQWVLLNGEVRTGVTTFFIEKGVDTGDIILQRELQITPEDNAGSLHDRMAQMGAEVIVSTVELISKGQAPRKKQVGVATKAPKITREMCQLDWQKPREDLLNRIRAFSPFPGAFTTLNGRIVKILNAGTADSPAPLSPGRVVAADGELIVCGGDGWIAIHEIQIAGKRRLPAAEFLRGIDENMLEPGFA